MKAEDSPKVSIIIPVYNGSNYLAEAIDSALAQTYENIEVIVINDGSNDEGATEMIAKSYGDKTRYFQKENSGVASTLNFGIQKMTGSYFSWLSHDDLYEKTKIEEQINLAKSSKTDNTIVVSNARSLFPSGIKKKGLINKKTFKYFDIFLATSANVGINGCALLIPEKALIESGGFDPALPVTQDYDLWYRLSSLHKYKFVLLERNLVVYRIHEGQDSIQKQKLCLEAGDDLRYEILNNIDYKRFEEYLMEDKANLRHAWSNYTLYKARGFKKTASIMLKNILRYYHENDLQTFYKAYYSEVETEIAAGSSSTNSGLLGLSGKKNKLTDDERRLIDAEYSRFLSSGFDGFFVKESPNTDKNPHDKSKARRIIWVLRESVRRDGIYLTCEKIVRKTYSRIKNRS